MKKLKIGEIPVWCNKCEKYYKFVSPYEVMCRCGKTIYLEDLYKAKNSPKAIKQIKVY
jgi:hypothetical protein